MKVSENMQIGIGIIGLAIAYMAIGKKAGEGGTGGGGGLDIPFINPQGGAVSGLAPEIAPEAQPMISMESFLGLIEGTFKSTGNDTYSGERQLSDKKVYVEGNLGIVGNMLNRETGQIYSQLSSGERLYSEKSTTDIPKKASSSSSGSGSGSGSSVSYGTTEYTGGSSKIQAAINSMGSTRYKKG